MGALLIQRGILVLRGNTLEKNDQAIVCLGHSGAGKSTLAYALMQQGWRLLADDLVAMTPEGMVLPGTPRIKLWHDAAKAFKLDPAALPPIREGMNKYLLQGLRNQAFRPRFVRGPGQEGANFMALARLQQQVPLATLPLPAGIGPMQRWLEDQDLLTAAAKAETGEEEPALVPAVS